MQSVIDAAKSAATAAATYTGLAHPDPETHVLPPDAQLGETRKMDSEGLAVFEGEDVRHEVLVKLNKLALEDARHGLKEVAALDLVGADGVKKGIQYYHPLRYLTVTRPTGVDYIGEIEIEEGKSIHVRAHKAGPGNPATYHSLDTRPGEDGGAVFNTGEPLVWFDY
ncbi:hypothetical protein IAT38_008392 [Cryptococcus sp. DSM 104549]